MSHRGSFFADPLIHWKKVAEALFSDITSSAVGKRRDQRKSPAGFPFGHRGMTFADYLTAHEISRFFHAYASGRITAGAYKGVRPAARSVQFTRPIVSGLRSE
jgi:hypothetical protein